MKLNGSTIGSILGGAFVASVIGWFLWTTIRKSDDPARMVFKWVLTAGLLAFMFLKVAPMVGAGGYEAAFTGIPLTAFCGLGFAIIWRHSIASLIAKPFASLYDGGDVPPEPKPAYSVAQARQKQGKYLEAIEEIQKQLDRFPTDFEGHLLMAQVQAENLKDLRAAEMTMDHFISQPNHAQANIAFAFYSLADWHLQVAQDRESARRWLEQIIQRLPNTEYALGASHRIAHLGNLEMLLSPHDRKKFVVEAGVHNLGLLENHDHLKPVETNPAEIAREYVRHLAEHPLDTEAREQLALIYANHYNRLDLATQELEQMINQPHQPHRLVVSWLNLLADLQIKHGADYDTARQTVQRIIDLDPNLAAAQIARNRIDRLKLELKSQQKSQAVKLGSYEQNIGLK